MKKSFDIKPRASIDEETARRLEERLAARGDAVPGQATVLSWTPKPQVEPQEADVRRLEVVADKSSTAPSLSATTAAQPPAVFENVGMPEHAAPIRTTASPQPPPIIAESIDLAELPAADEAARQHDLTTDPSEETAADELEQPPALRTTSPRRRAPAAKPIPLSLNNRQGTRDDPYIRKDGVKTRATTVTLPIDIARKLAIHCAQTGSKQSDIIAAAIIAFIR